VKEIRDPARSHGRNPAYGGLGASKGFLDCILSEPCHTKRPLRQRLARTGRLCGVIEEVAEVDQGRAGHGRRIRGRCLASGGFGGIGSGASIAGGRGSGEWHFGEHDGIEGYAGVFLVFKVKDCRFIKPVFVELLIGTSTNLRPFVVAL